MQVEHSMVYHKRVLESMSVSDQLHTYPFPDPTTVKLYQVRVSIGLGEGRCAAAQILKLIQVLHDCFTHEMQ